MKYIDLVLHYAKQISMMKNKNFIFFQTKMTKKQDQLATLEELLGKIETEVKRAKLMLGQLQGKSDKELEESIENSSKQYEETSQSLLSYGEWGDVKVIEWVYDGYFMIGADKKKYPVPMNYSSKSKLIPGDVLKLRVMGDGKLIYKLIGQAERKFIKATLSKADETGKFTALSDEWSVYFLNQAAVTYFKGNTGDELSIIINADGIGNFAAIEALIPQQQS